MMLHGGEGGDSSSKMHRIEIRSTKETSTNEELMPLLVARTMSAVPWLLQCLIDRYVSLNDVLFLLLSAFVVLRVVVEIEIVQ